MLDRSPLPIPTRAIGQQARESRIPAESRAESNPPSPVLAVVLVLDIRSRPAGSCWRSEMERMQTSTYV